MLGYIATSVLMKNTDDMMTLIVNSVRNDLMTGDDVTQCLALSACANLGGMELAETLSVDVQRLLTRDRTKNVVLKKAALCLLRLFRYWLTSTLIY